MVVKQKIWVVVLVLFPLLALGGLFYGLHVKHQHPSDIINRQKTPLDFEDNQVQCPQCHMYLVGKKHTAQAIDTAGKTYFFDDPGCLILWIKEQKIASETLTLWIYSMDTHRWIDMRKAHFDTKEITPMGHGFAAYENAQEGFIDFEEMHLHMLRGESMANPKIKKQLLGQ